MAGRLIHVQTTEVTSAVAQVDLIGTTTDHVYMVTFADVQPVNDGTQLISRVLVGSSPRTSASYDRAWSTFSTSSIGNQYGANETFTYVSGSQTGTGTSETNQGCLYLHNFNNASSHSMVNVYGVNENFSQALGGLRGGWLYKVNEACNGIRFYFASGNIAKGRFSLYRIE